MSAMMDRNTWLERILGAVRDLSDADYQERVWVRGRGPEADSSTEAVCRLLDDYDLAGFLAESGKRRWLSDDQFAALRAIEVALDNYLARDEDQIDDAVRIASPGWHELRKLARRTLEAFASTPGVTARWPLVRPRRVRRASIAMQP
jgi:hypothetical protein